MIPLPEESNVARRHSLLATAVGVFTRFGYRKTSMDDVARAAGVSRQGLYLSFSNKEQLFREAVEYSLSRQLRAALDVLSGGDGALEERLSAACDEWSGRYVGVLGADAADLMYAGTSLAGETLRHYETRFELALAAALGESPLAGVCRDAGVEVALAARALHAAARGLKVSCQSRQEFREAMNAAVRMFCAALGSTAGVPKDGR